MNATSQLIPILAIETATNACSVALSFNNTLIQRSAIEPKAHTRLILPMIDSVLKEAGLPLSQIEVFAYGCGPGSFTGVRIASAVIQGLGFGLEKPIIPVSSLRALAQQIFQEQSTPQICAMIDARMQEMYWGLFQANDQGLVELLGEEQLSAKEQCVLPEGQWIVTEGFPYAAEVAFIARAEYLLGKSKTALEALPVYLRNRIF